MAAFLATLLGRFSANGTVRHIAETQSPVGAWRASVQPRAEDSSERGDVGQSWRKQAAVDSRR
jgi:hypothetical protein